MQGRAQGRIVVEGRCQSSSEPVPNTCMQPYTQRSSASTVHSGVTNFQAQETMPWEASLQRSWIMQAVLVQLRSTTAWLICVQTLPIISALALFGTIAIVSCIIISLGPIAHVEQNSKTYSAVAPPRYIWCCPMSEL